MQATVARHWTDNHMGTSYKCEGYPSISRRLPQEVDVQIQLTTYRWQAQQSRRLLYYAEQKWTLKPHWNRVGRHINKRWCNSHSMQALINLEKWCKVAVVKKLARTQHQASRLLAQQQYVYVLCIWQPYLFFLIYNHLCIPCLADIFLFPYLCW